MHEDRVFHNTSIMRCLGTRRLDVQVVYINAHSHREVSPVDVDPYTCMWRAFYHSTWEDLLDYPTFSIEGETILNTAWPT